MQFGYHDAGSWPESYQRQHAALDVQRVWRGHLARQNTARLQCKRDRKLYREDQDAFLYPTWAATKIQTAWRVFTARQLLRKRRAEHRRQARRHPLSKYDAVPPPSRWRNRVQVPTESPAFTWAIWASAATAISAVWKGYKARQQYKRRPWLTPPISAEERQYLERKEVEMRQFFSRQHIEEEEARGFDVCILLKLQRNKWESNRRLVTEVGPNLEMLEAMQRKELEAEFHTVSVNVEEQVFREEVFAQEADERIRTTVDATVEVSAVYIARGIENEHLEAYLLDDAVFRQELLLHEMVERDIINKHFAVSGHDVQREYEAGRATIEKEGLGRVLELRDESARRLKLWKVNPLQARMQHTMEMEAHIRHHIQGSEEEAYGVLEWQIKTSVRVAQILTIVHGEEDDRYYNIEVKESNTWIEIMDKEEDQRSTLFLSAWSRQQIGERKKFAAMEGRARDAIFTEHRSQLVKLWGDVSAAGFLRRHWQLEEQEFVDRQIMIEEEKLVWHDLCWDLGNVLWHERIFWEEELGRRDLSQEQLKTSADLWVWFHHEHKRIDEHQRHNRRKWAEEAKASNEERHIQAKYISDCQFWEMRQRWELENEEDTKRQIWLVEEGKSWGLAQSLTSKRQDMERNEMMSAGFPIHEPPPTPPPVYARHPYPAVSRTPIGENRTSHLATYVRPQTREVRVQTDGVQNQNQPKRQTSSVSTASFAPRPTTQVGFESREEVEETPPVPECDGPPQMATSTFLSGPSSPTSKPSRALSPASVGFSPNSTFQDTIGYDDTITSIGALNLTLGLNTTTDSVEQTNVATVVDSECITFPMQAEEKISRESLMMVQVRTFEELATSLRPEYEKRLRQSTSSLSHQTKVAILQGESVQRQQILSAALKGFQNLWFDLSLGWLSDDVAHLVDEEVAARSVIEVEQEDVRLKSSFSPVYAPLYLQGAVMLQQAREDKEVVWAVGLSAGHHIGELFATIEGQMRGYARMRREEHMAWQSLLKQHRSFYAAALLDLVWREHHARIAVYLEEQEEWHHIMVHYTTALQKLLAASALGDCEKAEAKRRRALVKEEWTMNFQIVIQWDDLQVYRESILLKQREEQERERSIQDEVLGRHDVLQEYRAYVVRHFHHDLKQFEKTESVERRRVVLEEMRRREDWMELHEQHTVACQQANYVRCVIKTQSWWRGEMGRKLAKVRQRVSKHAGCALRVQCAWRALIAQRAVQKQRQKLEKRARLRRAICEFELIEQAEMEENEKLTELASLQIERVTFHLVAHERSERMDVERLQRRCWASIINAEFEEELAYKTRLRQQQLIASGAHCKALPPGQRLPHTRAPPWAHPNSKDSVVGLQGLPRAAPQLDPLAALPGAKSSLVPTLAPLSEAASAPGAATSVGAARAARRAQEEAEQRAREQKEALERTTEMCAQLLKTMGQSLRSEKSFQQRLFELNEAERRLPPVASPPAVLNKIYTTAPNGRGFMSPLTRSPAVAYEKERLKRLEALKQYALEPPLKSYAEDMAAGAHYNCEYLASVEALD
mmetsp:Transcript_95295/g.164463  ORF Transcript_95295/g.164463 Transcript_95295/m.164463 type:complete len:1530 (-) Transcript_95295:781-5370(-)